MSTKTKNTRTSETDNDTTVLKVTDEMDWLPPKKQVGESCWSCGFCGSSTRKQQSSDEQQHSRNLEFMEDIPDLDGPQTSSSEEDYDSLRGESSATTSRVLVSAARVPLEQASQFFFAFCRIVFSMMLLDSVTKRSKTGSNSSNTSNPTKKSEDESITTATTATETAL